MYMSGLIDIDPSHLTHVQRKPTKGFRRFAELITLGALTEKEELETFTAVAILQEINVALRSLQITDVVRFTKDGQVIYDDSDGLDEDDMPMVLKDLEVKKRTIERSGFETLSLLLEHHLPDVTLVIDVRVTRTHAVNKFPIQIIVNGLASEFQGSGDKAALTQQVKQAFATQDSYDAVQEKLKVQFESFLLQLETSVRRHMKIDDLQRHSQLNIVRPAQRASTVSKTDGAPVSSFDSDTAPVFQRYHSDADAFSYCWMWSSMMHNHNTQCRDVVIVDERGRGLVQVGEQGFVAGENNLLNSDEPFCSADASKLGLEPIDGGDSSSRSFGGSDVGDSSGGAGSWLDSFCSGGGESGGSDTGSSCSSCSSCGGGD